MPTPDSPLLTALTAVAARPETDPRLLERIAALACQRPPLAAALAGNTAVPLATALTVLPVEDGQPHAPTVLALLRRPDLDGADLTQLVRTASVRFTSSSDPLLQLAQSTTTPVRLLRALEPALRNGHRGAYTYSALAVHPQADAELALTVLRHLCDLAGTDQATAAVSGWGSGQGWVDHLRKLPTATAQAAFDTLPHAGLRTELLRAHRALVTDRNVEALAQVALLEPSTWKGRTKFGKTHIMTAALELVAEHGDPALRTRCAQALTEARVRVVGASPAEALGVTNLATGRRPIGTRTFRGVANSLSGDTHTTSVLAADLATLDDGAWQVFLRSADTFTGTVADLLDTCRAIATPRPGDAA